MPLLIFGQTMIGDSLHVFSLSQRKTAALLHPLEPHSLIGDGLGDGVGSSVAASGPLTRCNRSSFGGERSAAW